MWMGASRPSAPASKRLSHISTPNSSGATWLHLLGADSPDCGLWLGYSPARAAGGTMQTCRTLQALCARQHVLGGNHVAAAQQAPRVNSSLRARNVVDALFTIARHEVMAFALARAVLA